MELLEPAVQGVRVGDPMDESTEMGPLVAAPHLDRVRSFVPDDSRRRLPRRGARRPGVLVRAHRAHPVARRPHGARGDLRARRRGVPVRRRGATRSASRTQRVRPVGVDLHARPRAAASESPAASSGQPRVNSHSSVRYATPVRRLEAVGPRSRARTRRAPRTSPRPRTSSSPSTRAGDRLARSAYRDPHPEPRTGAPMADLPASISPSGSPAASPSSPAARAGIGLATAQRLAAEGATVVIGDIDATAGAAAAELVDGLFLQVNVADEEQVNDALRRGGAGLRVGRHRVQQRRHLAARRRLDRDHRAAGVADGAGRQPQDRSTCARARRCGTWSRRAAGRSSTRRRSSRCSDRRRRRSRTPRRRAACSR